MKQSLTQKQVLSALRSRDYMLLADLALSACEPGPSVSSPNSLFPLLLPWSCKKQEHFLVVTLDGAHQVIKIHEISKGLVNRTIVHPREVFRPALLDNAVAMVIAHNHPSARLDPSPEDREITPRILEAGEVLGITVLDHIIIGRKSYYSFAEHGLISSQEDS